MESTIKKIRKKLPNGLGVINCRMLSLGICNFTKQKVNMQDKQQEMQFTWERKMCPGQNLSTSHNKTQARVQHHSANYPWSLRKICKRQHFKAYFSEADPWWSLSETLMMNFKTEYLGRISESWSQDGIDRVYSFYLVLMRKESWSRIDWRSGRVAPGELICSLLKLYSKPKKAERR